jgi:MSHA biogenesis protein MshO
MKIVRSLPAASGFTLIELVMVITVTAVVAAAMTVFLKPAFQSYVDTKRRAELGDAVDVALRRIGMDVRRAVPNSIRSVAGFSGTCVQLVPQVAGGRFRRATDVTNDAATCAPASNPTNCSAAVDVSTTTSVFDVLSPLPVTPAVGDWVVIGNQNADDVYAGTNRSAITAVTTPHATDGLSRLVITAKQFPSGYEGGAFGIVANSEQSVFYSCVGGVLYRTAAAFGANQATTCAATSGAVVTRDVAACSFVYDPSVGATQQGGMLWAQLKLSRDGESVTLSSGSHVDNTP